MTNKPTIYTIFHLDGSLTLVEITPKERIFTPIDSLGQLRNYLDTIDADCPEDNLITETETESWPQLLQQATERRVFA